MNYLQDYLEGKMDMASVVSTYSHVSMHYHINVPWFISKYTHLLSSSPGNKASPA